MGASPHLPLPAPAEGSFRTLTSPCQPHMVSCHAPWTQASWAPELLQQGTLQSSPNPPIILRSQLGAQGSQG